VYDTSKPIEKVLARLNGVKRTGSGYSALCPAHDDHEQSLSVSEGKDGRVLLKCHRGCKTENIVAAIGLTMADLFPRKSNSKKPDNEGITLAELAADKGLPIDLLQSVGVIPAIWHGIHGVKITYRLMNGTPAPRQRFRYTLKAKKGSKWIEGKGSPVPYGLWMLQKMRAKSDALVLVEGESDSWTLWYHGIPALGIPGADMGGKLQLEHIELFSKIYIYQEPDEGGTIFTEKLIVHLRKIGWSGSTFIIHARNGFKDPNELHKANPVEFKNTFQEMTNNATPIDINAPATEENLAPEFRCTDLGNARRLVKRHGQKFDIAIPGIAGWFGTGHGGFSICQAKSIGKLRKQ